MTGTPLGQRFHRLPDLSWSRTVNSPWFARPIGALSAKNNLRIRHLHAHVGSDWYAQFLRANSHPSADSVAAQYVINRPLKHTAEKPSIAHKDRAGHLRPTDKKSRHWRVFLPICGQRLSSERPWVFADILPQFEYIHRAVAATVLHRVGQGGFRQQRALAIHGCSTARRAERAPNPGRAPPAIYFQVD